MFSSREKLALTGGILIVVSGLVSIWIGARAGYMLYQPDPGGVFGHVGVWAGVAAIVIGSILIWIAFHEPASPPGQVVVGLLTVVLGHLGAIAGALLVGTAGVLLCYVTGIWLMVRGVRLWRRQGRQPNKACSKQSQLSRLVLTHKSCQPRLQLKLASAADSHPPAARCSTPAIRRLLPIRTARYAACQVVLRVRQRTASVMVSVWAAPIRCASRSRIQLTKRWRFFGEVPGMLGASRGDTQRAYVLPSVIEEEFSAAQSGASHYQARRNRYG